MKIRKVLSFLNDGNKILALFAVALIVVLAWKLIDIRRLESQAERKYALAEQMFKEAESYKQKSGIVLKEARDLWEEYRHLIEEEKMYTLKAKGLYEETAPKE